MRSWRGWIFPSRLIGRRLAKCGVKMQTSNTEHRMREGESPGHPMLKPYRSSGSRSRAAAEGQDYADDGGDQSRNDHPNGPVGGRAREGLGEAGGEGLRGLDAENQQHNARNQ